MSHIQTINLSKLIPYEFTLSADFETMELTKGIIYGQIKLDSLKLELEKVFSIPIKSIDFKPNEQSDLLLIITSNLKINIDEVSTLIQKTISKELPFTLINKDTKKPLHYITKDLFEIPLVGSIYFGIIDRGTSLLQVRPITGCPLNCPFCSVDEGPASKNKLRDYIVDLDYLSESYNYVVSEKNIQFVEAHLDGQGEPTAYPYLVDLIQKFWENKSTKIVSIQTNGWYLTEKLIDELAEVNLTRINLSINTMSPKFGERLSGRGDYNLTKILDLAKYITNSKISLLIAPVWISNINDKDIEDIIKFSLKINSNENKFPVLGIQNYLIHDQGRFLKGVKQKKFSIFYKQLRDLEQKYNIKKLVLEPELFNTYKTHKVNNPMKINEKVLAEMILPGRVHREVIAKANNRLIHINNVSNFSPNKKIRIRIIRNQDNIFFGIPI